LLNVASIPAVVFVVVMETVVAAARVGLSS
jgi:hypothetical protein